MPDKMSDLWWLFTRQTVTVTQNENLLNAAVLMHRRAFRHLPVIVRSGKIVGILSAQDVVDSLNLASRSSATQQELLKALDIPLERVMAISAIAVEQGDGLEDVVKKLIYNNIGALPVVSEQGVVQGIVTLRDLIGLMGIRSDPIGVPVSEVMTSPLTTVTPDTPVTKAVQLMSELRVRRLPVLDGERVAGVVTSKDVLRLLYRMSSEETVSFREPVSELMTRDVITISKSEDLRVAASNMMIFGIGGLLVNDHGEPALVTERDLVRTLARRRSVELLVKAMQYESEVAALP